MADFKTEGRKMVGFPKLLLAALCLSGIIPFALAQDAPGPPRSNFDLGVICSPCSVAKTGDTHVTITAGIRNRGTAVSGNLRLVLGAASLPRGSFIYSELATAPHAPIAGGMASSSREFTVAYRFPGASAFDADGNTQLVLALQEYNATAGVDGMGGWLTSDIVRLAPAGETAMALTQSRMALTRARMVPPSGGETRNGSIYIEGEPTMTVTGTGNSMMVAVTIPKVGNSGEESITLTSANLVHTHARQFFNVTSVAISATRGAVTLGTAVTIAPGGIATNVSFTSTYVNPVNASVNNGGSTTTENFDYTHLLLLSASSIEVWINVRNDSGTALPNTNFTANNIDFLNDEDADGVTDYSEGLAGTNPALGTSMPDKLNLDLMVVYTAEVAAALSNDPMSRITQHVEYANMALTNSGIDAQYKLVHTKEVTYTEQNFDNMLTAMQKQTTPFVGIDTERERVGADLLLLYVDIPRPEGMNDRTALCGKANATGLRREGDLFQHERMDIVAAVNLSCHASTLAHELGHNLGLGHSYKQGDIGTWEWSRGYGVNDQFVTIMGYASEFDVTANRNTKQIYSNPDIIKCGSGTNGLGTAACGVDRTMTAGADATRSIKATMFQIAALTEAAEATDTDNDGLTDARETALGTDPNDADSDDDGLTDGAEVNTHMTDPNDADSDDDGLTDGAEVNTHMTDPDDADSDDDRVNDKLDAFPNDRTETVDTDMDGTGNNTDLDDDGDGLTDEKEATLGTDPLLADTDGDRTNDMADALPLDPSETIDRDMDGVGANRDTNDNNVNIAYEADKGSLHADGANPAKVIADLDDPALIRFLAGRNIKYELSGVFISTNLANWNRFEEEDEAAGVD